MPLCLEVTLTCASISAGKSNDVVTPYPFMVFFIFITCHIKNTATRPKVLITTSHKTDYAIGDAEQLLVAVALPKIAVFGSVRSFLWHIYYIGSHYI